MVTNLRGELTEPQSKGVGRVEENETSRNTATSLGLASSSFLSVVFDALQDANMIGKASSNKMVRVPSFNGDLAAFASASAEVLADVGNNEELNAMDDIQRALLPTLMCSAAAQGLTEVGDI
jgi:hypothetical protein